VLLASKDLAVDSYGDRIGYNHNGRYARDISVSPRWNQLFCVALQQLRPSKIVIIGIQQFLIRPCQFPCFSSAMLDQRKTQRPRCNRLKKPLRICIFFGSFIFIAISRREADRNTRLPYGSKACSQFTLQWLPLSLHSPGPSQIPWRMGGMLICGLSFPSIRPQAVFWS
jgi:hypothetical protein